MSIPLFRRNVNGQQIYYCRILVDGKVKARSTGATDKGEALSRAIKLQVAADKTAPEGDQSLSYEEAWDRYHVWAYGQKRPNTISNEKIFWLKFWNWAPHNDVYRVTPEQVAAFKVHLLSSISKTGQRYSPHTVNDILRAIGGIYAHLLRLGVYSGINPFQSKVVGRVRVPKPKRDFLEPEQLRSLLELAKLHSRDLHLFVALGAFAGLRKREILNLRWKDIDFRRETPSGEQVGCITVWEEDGHTLKTVESNRVVPLHSTLRPILEYYKPERDCRREYVIRPEVKLPGKGGYRWEPRKALGTLGKQLGREVHPHLLRHTFASLLVQAGVPLKKISGWLGHTSVETTEIYAHLAPVDSDISRLG